MEDFHFAETEQKPPGGTMIRPAQLEDADAIARIYNHYIHNTVITFEEQPVTQQAMAERVDEISGAALPWLVAVNSSRVVGYAYASPWKSRSAYRYSVESTIYLDPAALGIGLGSQLYEALLARLGQRNIHVVIGGIALPNPASIRLHEKFGFRKIAHFEEVGYKFGRWVDVGYWQRIL
jgi:phosphinothricin acetyltransferase